MFHPESLPTPDGATPAPPTPPAPPTSPSDAEYERLTLAYWLGCVPDLDDVTITVRRGGRVVRFLLLEHPSAAGTSTADPPEGTPEGTIVFAGRPDAST